MILTEEEAKTKACQEATRAAALMSHVSIGINGMAHAVPAGPLVISFDRCIGSACMAWRWVREDHWRTPFRIGDVATTEPYAGKGFCGKAGKP